MNKPVIFISHIVEEGDLAQILKRRLTDCFLGLIKVFVSSDRESISAGKNWLASIDQALREADIELILCSRASVGQPWVNFEAGAAWMKEINVIPVCHSGLRPEDLSMPLAVLQAVKANQEAGLDQIFALVASRLGAAKPCVALSEIAKEVRSFEESYERRICHVPRPDSSAGGPQADRVVGSWEGTASDIEVPEYPPLELKCSYQLQLDLRREGSRICGELTVHINERPGSYLDSMELINIAGDNFTFSYRLINPNANHFGIMMFHLLPHGEQMKGYFLTNKAFEPKLATGVVEFHRKTS